ncbi:MAG: hypothetical protein PF961_05850 [Planctomycetota bacterium]|nr:hypothetical protein [Planctomycetota bacterium]
MHTLHQATLDTTTIRLVRTTGTGGYRLVVLGRRGKLADLVVIQRERLGEDAIDAHRAYLEHFSDLTDEIYDRIIQRAVDDTKKIAAHEHRLKPSVIRRMRADLERYLEESEGTISNWKEAWDSACSDASAAGLLDIPPAPRGLRSNEVDADVGASGI